MGRLGAFNSSNLQVSVSINYVTVVVFVTVVMSIAMIYLLQTHLETVITTAYKYILILFIFIEGHAPIFLK